MKLGVIADDFTGASDIGLTLAEGGMRVAQFVGIPKDEDVSDLDAAVISLKSRTAPIAEAVEQSLRALAWLQKQGAKQIIYKICSTFDSTKSGNIGPVLDALSEQMRTPIALVCPAFPENGRSVYQGHLFVGDKPLNESGMQNHPLTPMTDSDIRRWLGHQTKAPIHHIDAATVKTGAASITAALPKQGYVILDAIEDADLLKIGAAAKNQALLCGGSGIALGLPQNFGIQDVQSNWTPRIGKGVILSGSCSIATRGQVEHYKANAPTKELIAAKVMSDNIMPDDVANWVLDQNTAPLVYSSADPQIVQEAQNQFGKERIASKIETFFSDLAAKLKTAGIARIVVAGGETSGAVVTGLNASRLDIGPRIAAGVPVLSSGNMALALKSGNFGNVDFFGTALQQMGSEE